MSVLAIGKRWETDWVDDVDILALGDGVQVKIMYRDDEAGLINMLLKFPPGYVEPRHSHDAEHSGVVLEGLQIVDGVALHPGDTLHAPANVPHGPFSYPEGCVLFTSFRGKSARHEIEE
jgi:quercetin dioxygenase-like cupin family protein